MLQPFKFITVVMKERTNKGMQEESVGKPNMKPLITLVDDLRYHPVTLDEDGYGVPISADNKADHASIGVLMESFNKTFAQHKVLIHGIVPMKAHSGVKAGMPAYWDELGDAGKGELNKDATKGPLVGKALTSAHTDGDIINVLIG